MQIFDLSSVRRAGAAKCGNEAVTCLERSGAEGFWVDLDADVLDDAVMPAVDYRLPGGLAPDELAAVLGTALHSDSVIGMDITIYNPCLDDLSLSAGRVLADIVSRALAESGAET